MGLRIERRPLTKACALLVHWAAHQGTLGKVRRRGAIGFLQIPLWRVQELVKAEAGRLENPEGEEARGASRQKAGHERARSQLQVWHRGLWESRISVSRKPPLRNNRTATGGDR